MIALVEFDNVVKFAQQLAAADDQPIVLINRFHVDVEHEAEFLELWKVDAGFMLSNGCASGQLHKGTAGSRSYVNVAHWPKASSLARAFTSREFQQLITRYPTGCTVSQHVFVKVAVEGVCSAD